MGMLTDLVAGQAHARVDLNDMNGDVMKCADIALAKLDWRDREEIERIEHLFLPTNTSKKEHLKLRNFGPRSVWEAIMKVGILLASLSDREFEELQRERARRRKNSEFGIAECGIKEIKG